MIYAKRYCKTCNKQVRAEKKESISTGLGILLSLITAGVFIPIWVIAVLIDWAAPLRCPNCGSKL